jgi:hypothetical protein
MSCNKIELNKFYSIINNIKVLMHENNTKDLSNEITFIEKNNNNEEIKKVLVKLLSLLNCESIQDTEIEIDIETLFPELKCFCLSNKDKNKEYYKFEYIPPEHINEYKKSSSENIDDLLNMESKTNCCNCITFILYNNDYTINNINYLIGVLLVLYLSLNNIEKYLNKLFIARIYFDVSVFTLIFNFYIFNDNNQFSFYSRFLLTLIIKIITHNVSEIYIYFCQDYNQVTNGRKRMYRFLPFIQEDTNVVLSWDIDNLLSHNICFYIKKFYESDKIFFLHVIFDNILEENRPYQYWLNRYSNFIKNNNHFLNLLAGCFGLKIKINKLFFYESITKISINFMKDNNDLWFAFDEILLYDLFHPFLINTNYNKKLFYLLQKKEIEKKIKKEENNFITECKKIQYFNVDYFNGRKKIINPLIEQFSYEYETKFNENIEVNSKSLNLYYYEINKDTRIDTIINLTNYTNKLFDYFDLNVYVNQTDYEKKINIEKEIDIEIDKEILIDNDKLTYLDRLKIFNNFFNLIYKYNETEYKNKYLKYKSKYLNYKYLLLH